MEEKGLITSRYFRTKETVEKSAYAVLRFFQDNPKADFLQFYSWAYQFGLDESISPNLYQLTKIADVLENARLIPPVRQKILQKINRIKEEKAKKGIVVGSQNLAKILKTNDSIIRSLLDKRVKVNSKNLYSEFAKNYLDDGAPKTLEGLLPALYRSKEDFFISQIERSYANYLELGATCSSKARWKGQCAARATGKYYRKRAKDFDPTFQRVEKCWKVTFNHQEGPKNRENEKEDFRNAFISDTEDSAKEIEYNNFLESQVVTPPAWYVEEVWGNYRLPGVHLPHDMFARYLEIYEKKRTSGTSNRCFHKTNHRRAQ